MDKRTALLAGATGLVGGHCLDLLLSNSSYDRVVSLGRRPLTVDHEKLYHYVVEYPRLGDFREFITGQDVFCCLGTTIKKAGSREAFRQVDYSYPSELARYALENGADQFLLVSSLGANKNAPVFYSRVKGEVEETIGNMPFDAVYIFRPSLLRGDRQEVRRGEELADSVFEHLSFLFKGPLAEYRPIEARMVAEAMVASALNPERGLNVFGPSDIRSVAEKRHQT